MVAVRRISQLPKDFLLTSCYFETKPCYPVRLKIGDVEASVWEAHWFDITGSYQRKEQVLVIIEGKATLLNIASVSFGHDFH